MYLSYSLYSSFSWLFLKFFVKNKVDKNKKLKYCFKKRFHPIVEWFRWDFCENLTKTNPSIFYVHILHQAVFLLIEFEVGFFLHSLHKGLEFRHLLPYCPKSWNMNFWRINASIWSRNLYEVALWFYKAEFFRVSIFFCIPCFFLCVQLLINAPTRKHEFERQILLTWIDSALQKRTESIKTILWNGMVSYINFWPQCALGLLASVLWR